MKMSVVTVCLNSADTIEKTIQSVIGQTYKELEYIIIDGGSTDETLDIIKKYSDEISFWSSDPDEGIYDAMNKGIAHATGDVISFLNSSDWYQPETLQVVADKFEQYNCEIVCGRGVTVRDGEYACFFGPESEKMIFKRMVYPHQTLFTKKEIFQTYGKFDLSYRISSDYDWLMRVIKGGANVCTCDEILTYFTYGGASSGIKCFDESKKISLKHLDLNDDEYELKYREIIHEYEQRIRIGNIRMLTEKIRNAQIQISPILELLYNKFGIKDSCYLFGGGYRSYDYCDFLENVGINIAGICDNNIEKHGMKIHDITIISIDMLKDEKPILITVQGSERQIAEQLKRSGFDKIIRYSEFMETIYSSFYQAE